MHLLFGSSDEVDDTEEVEHESGASRLMSAMCMAVCVAPVVIVLSGGLVGWNEKRAVCEAKALDAGLMVAQAASCSSPSQHSGSLIVATCDVQKEGLPSWRGDGDFNSQNHVGVGLNTKAEMFCCIETKDSSTKKDNLGGGKTTTTKYKYNTGWVDYSELSGKCPSRFHSSQTSVTCDSSGNPAWPAGAPTGQTKYAEQIKVGSYTIKENDMISHVSLNTRITDWTSPSQWKKEDAGTFSSSKLCNHQQAHECIGKVRVSFNSNDWAHKSVTFAGENTNGVVGKWIAPSSWLCSGSTVGNLKEGQLSKDQIFSKLKEESHTMTIVLRLVGFVALWMAFACCFAPCEVLLDCIPCIGPMLGDCFSCVACCVACPPATVCFLGIAGAMWCVMRPLIGIPCMIVWFLFMGGLGYYVYSRRDDIGKKGNAVQQSFMPPGSAENPSYGTAMAQPVMAQPMPRQMQVVVPPGSGPGDMVQVFTPEGAAVQAEVPQGVPPGGMFMMQY